MRAVEEPAKARGVKAGARWRVKLFVGAVTIPLRRRAALEEGAFRMVRILAILLAIAAVPWVISTWWQMRRARSARERSFIGRSSLGVTLLAVAGVVVFGLLSGRGQIAALPLFLVSGFALHHSLKKARMRIRDEEGDPVARAKRVN